MGIRRTVHDQLALVHHLTVVHHEVLVLRDQELVRGAIRLGDDQALLALGLLAEGHRAGVLGEHAGILGRTGLEEFGNARQTTGDVAGLCRFLRNTGKNVTNVDLLAVLDRDQRADLEGDRHRMLGPGDLHFFAIAIEQLHLRAHALGGAGRRTPLGVDDHQSRQTGDLVDLLGDGRAFLDVLELHRAGVFGHDRAGVRVPARQLRAGLDRLAVVDQQQGTVRQLVAFALTTEVIGHDQLGRTRDDDLLALGVGDVAHVAGESDRAGGLGLHPAGCCRSRRRTADVEGPHRQLRAGLADRLCGNDADRLAGVDHAAATEVATVALRAQTIAGLAGQRRAHLDFIDAKALDQVDCILVQQAARLDHRLLRLRIHHVLGAHAAEDALAQGLDHLATLDEGFHVEAFAGAAVVLDHHQILGHIDQAAGKVTRVRGLQRGIGQTLTGAVRRDEVLQNVEAFTEVRRDRRLDDRAVRLGHQAAHAGKLADLGSGTTSTRVGHHVDRVERLLADGLALAVDHLFGTELLHHRLGDLVATTAPDIHDLVVALAIGDEAGGVLLRNLLHLGLGGTDQVVLRVGHKHVLDRDRQAGAGSQAVAELHQLVGEDHGCTQAATAERGVDELGDLLLLERLVDHAEGQTRRQDLGQDGAAGGRVVANDPLDALTVRAQVGFLQAHRDARMERDLAGLVGTLHFRHVGEDHALARHVHAFAGRVVQAQHDVLRRHDDRLAVGRRQHVVGGQHQGAGFHLCFQRQRNVDGHLVAVEVGVEGDADERVELDRLAFDQYRLESLDAEAVQRRSAVQHDRVLADHLFEDVPHHRLLRLHHLLGLLDGCGQPHQLELVEDEGLEQLERHQLGQTALMQLELRTHGNHRTAGVVDTLAEQVLTEAAALALDHVGQRLERTLVGAGHRLAATAVVEQRVDRLLQHALLVAHDDVGRLELEQTLETVVTVDDATIEVVEVGGGEATTVQRHQRTQVGGQHRQHLEHHPLGLDAGLLEGLEHLQALRELLDLGFRVGRLQVAAQLLDLEVDVQAAQQRGHTLGAHHGVELVTVLFDLRQVVVLGEQLTTVERGHARLDDDEGLEIEHALDVSQGHVEHHAETARQALQEPDVGDRRGQFDVAHALTADLGQGHFHAALLADHATVLEPLVLAAQALVVLDRAKDLGAEQAVTLRLERTVVDGLGFLDFPIGPGPDLVRGRETDGDRVELFLVRQGLLEQVSEQALHCSLHPGRSRLDCVPGIQSRAGCLVRDQLRSRSMSIASERISFTSTLKDSGMPESILCSPLTMFSYTLVRPVTSSDLTVSISCSV